MTAWTPEEDKRLADMWVNLEDLSAAEIGNRMGRSRNAVIGRTHRLKLPCRAEPRGPTPARGYGEKLLIARKRTAELKAARDDSLKHAQPTRKRNLRDPSIPPSPHKDKPTMRRGPCPPEVRHKGLAPVDLKPGQCHWPEGDGPFTFCGHNTGGSGQNPYCAYHQWIGTKPTPKLTGVMWK